VKLAQRLLLGAVLIVSVLTIVAVTLSGQRLRDRLQQLSSTQLAREARLIAQQWRPGVSPDPLADSAAAALGPPPVVTIQLPLYNEMYVADRLIEADAGNRNRVRPRTGRQRDRAGREQSGAGRNSAQGRKAVRKTRTTGS